MSRLADKLGHGLTPPVPPFSYYYNLGRAEGYDRAEDASLEAAYAYYLDLSDRLAGVPKFAADDLAAFVLDATFARDETGGTFWDRTLPFPPLVLPARYFWMEFRRPASKHPCQSPAVDIEDFPPEWGWLVAGCTYDDFASRYVERGAEPPDCEIGLDCYLATRYAAHKGKEYAMFPMAVASIPLHGDGTIAGKYAINHPIPVDQTRVASPVAVFAFFEALLNPLLVALALGDRLKEVHVAPSPKVVAKRLARGVRPPCGYVGLDSAAAIEMLRYQYKAGILGLPAAMAALARDQNTRPVSLIIPGR